MFIMVLSNSPILAQIRGEHLMEPTIHLSSQITMNRKKTLKTPYYDNIWVYNIRSRPNGHIW